MKLFIYSSLGDIVFECGIHCSRYSALYAVCREDATPQFFPKRLLIVLILVGFPLLA